MKYKQERSQLSGGRHNGLPLLKLHPAWCRRSKPSSNVQDFWGLRRSSTPIRVFILGWDVAALQHQGKNRWRRPRRHRRTQTVKQLILKCLYDVQKITMRVQRFRPGIMGVGSWLARRLEIFPEIVHEHQRIAQELWIGHVRLFACLSGLVIQFQMCHDFYVYTQGKEVSTCRCLMIKIQHFQ